MNINLTGRIDANNAAEVEAKITKTLADNPNEAPVFDASSLEYISSAGLRVLLKFRKRFGEKLEVVNASNAVYDIFEVTGFNELFRVRKKLREVSIEDCPVIGGGATSTVYRLDPETIIKVFDKKPVTPEQLEVDQRTAREVFLHDIPTAISYDVVRAGGHYGIVYEMIDADTLSRTLRKHPERLEELSLKTAHLFKKLHTTEFEPETFPSIKSNFKDAASRLFEDDYITADDKAVIESVIDRVPDRNTFVHRDFHPGNILVRDDDPEGGELILIDVGDSGLGHPVFDLAISFAHFVAIPRFSAEQGNSFHEHVIGLNYKELGAMWDVMGPEYFGTADAETLARNDEVLKHYATIFEMAIAGMFSPFPYDMNKARITSLMDSLREAADTLNPIEG